MFIVLILMITVPLLLFGDKEITQNFSFGFGGSSDGDMEDLKKKAPKNIKAVVTDKKVEVYKWTDEHGIMQFSSIPPQEGYTSEMMVLSPNTNVLDAVKIPEKEKPAELKQQVFNVGSAYTPSGMKKMVDDSSELQEKLNQRQADQDKMIQDLFPQK